MYRNFGLYAYFISFTVCGIKKMKIKYLFVIPILVLPLILNVPLVFCAWYNTNWYRRVSHRIQGTIGTVQTDYVVNITIVRTSGTDEGNIIYIPECQSNYGDIRFIDSDGSTLLNYWLDNKTVTSQNATFYVEVPTIPKNPEITTFYVYYLTNGWTTTSSNGHNTFIRFEDFEDFNLGDWTPNASRGFWVTSDDPKDNISIANSPNGFDTQVLEISRIDNDLSQPPTVYLNLSLYYFNLTQHFWIQIDDEYGEVSLRYRENTTQRLFVEFQDEDSDSNLIKWHTGTLLWNFTPSAIWNDDEWIEYNAFIQDDGAYDLDIKLNSSMHDGDWQSTPSNGLSLLDFYLSNGANFKAYFDDYFIRKYVVPEPIHLAGVTEIRSYWWQDHITFFIGISGFAMFIISPVYTIRGLRKWREEALPYGFLLFILGIGFIMVWLWG